MSSSEEFWLITWGIVALIICTLIIAITTYSSTKASKIVASEDPMLTSCAFDYSSPVCLVYLTKLK